MRRAIRDPAELCQLLGLADDWSAGADPASQAFPLFAPREYVARMQPGNPDDPLLRQVLPRREELVEAPGFSSDPVGDAAATLAPGILQKYHGRALLITTGVCAIHCRYCFRRHFPYGEAPHSPDEWEPSLRAIAADASIEEAILSGGDPLTLVDARLEPLVERLASIGHLRRLRIHSRLPIVIPQRVTDCLLALLTGSHLQPIMVVHANHPAEIDGPTADAIRRMVEAGILVLNQAVLLRGVNDDARQLAELCRRMIELRAMPYYLHQLDRVAGAAHFEVPVVRGRAIMDELRKLLPGYAMPQYVQEIAGEPSKVPIV